MDRSDRKALLLTRSAIERQALALELTQLREAARPAHIVRSVVGPGWLSQWLDRRHAASPAAGAGPSAGGGWLQSGLGVLQRYPILMTLAGSVLSMRRRRRRARRYEDWDDDRPVRRRRRGGKLKLAAMTVVASATAWAVWRWRRR